jgi:hypothetical protein
MKIKFIISIAFIFLLFNSCKKIREKVFSTRMEGKVIDMQTGKGIPNARLVVYESQARQGSSNRNFYTLKTFYADQDGNFKDKIKISFTEEDDSYKSYFLKAEPDGYEETVGTDCYVSNCNENVPYVYLNLTKANKDIELKCNPEFALEINLVDEPPFFNGTSKNLLSFKTKTINRFYNIEYPPLSGNDNKAATIFYQNDTLVSFLLPAMEFDLLLYGNNNSVNPPTRMRLDSMRISHLTNKQITINY